MAEWFESWFDTKYYHLLYQDRNDREASAFISNLIGDLNVSKDAAVLDLCCGKGRHSKYLNSKGFDVVGADLSKQSIQYAKASENERLKFIVHDMRDKLPEFKFDLVLNLFTSFGYFSNPEENSQVINSIYSYLHLNGVLVIDFLNVHKAIAELVPNETRTAGGIEFTINKVVEDGMIKKSISFIDQGHNFQYEENVSVLDFEYFDQVLRNEGFEIIEIFGDYNLAPFNKFESDRLIIKAIKK